MSEHIGIDARKAVIIANPMAGGGKHEKHIMNTAKAVQNRLQDFHGWGVKISATEKPNQATQLAVDASRQGYPVVIAAGGDGTLNEVLQGISNGTALGCLRVGTVNIWANEIGIPKDPIQAADALASSNIYEIDLGEINRRKFLLMSEIGLTAEGFSKLQQPGQPKTRSGRLAYMHELMKMLHSDNPSTRAEIKIGNETLEVDLLQMLVQNTPGYANFSIGKPKTDDGVLAVTIGHGPSSRHIVIPWLHMLRRPGRDFHGITFRETDSLTVVAENPLYSHADGEVFDPKTVFDISTHRQSLKVLIPNTSTPSFLHSK